jgi:hypothetical protein
MLLVARLANGPRAGVYLPMTEVAPEIILPDVDLSKIIDDPKADMSATIGTLRYKMRGHYVTTATHNWWFGKIGTQPRERLPAPVEVVVYDLVK